MATPKPIQFEMVLRERQVSISCVVCGPDYSAGFTSRWAEEYHIYDAQTGEALDWELTEKEGLELDFAADTALANKEDVEINRRGRELDDTEL
jgi:hypothetical protein